MDVVSPLTSERYHLDKKMLTFLKYLDLFSIVTYSVTICLCFMFQSRPACKGRAIFASQTSMNNCNSSRVWGKISLLIILCGLTAFFTAAMVSCSSARKSTEQKSFKKRYKNYRYCDLTAVKQSTQTSCGVAALTSVLNYWKHENQPELTEKELAAQYPAKSSEGYPILQLREIALRNGVAAFAVTLDENPWRQLTEHVDKGRPVITAVRLPRGRYFGKTIPLLETLDRRTLMSTGNEWKSHYIVVIGRSYKDVVFMDPEHGIVHTNRDAFMNFWRQEKYAALICSALPAPGNDSDP